MIKKLKQIYTSEQFNPKALGIFINPWYFVRKGIYKYISELAPKLTGKLLDIGCGAKPYKNLCSVDEYIGLEIDDEGNRQNQYADILYDGKIMPFKNNTFDSLMCHQVLEHIFNPSQFLRETNRVIKMGGYFY